MKATYISRILSVLLLLVLCLSVISCEGMEGLGFETIGANSPNSPNAPNGSENDYLNRPEDMQTTEPYSVNETDALVPPDDETTENEGEEGTTRPPNQEDTNENAETTAPGSEFQNVALTFLTSLDMKHPEFYDNPGASQVESLLYERNMRAKEALGIELYYKGIPTLSDKHAFLKELEFSVNSGNPYDAVSAPANTVAACALSGYLTNLNGIQNSALNLSADWWPSSALGETTIQEKLYFVTGDISISNFFSANVLFVNMDFLRTINLPEPQTLVLDMKWTWTKMVEYSALGGASGVGYTGTILSQNSPMSFYFGAGGAMVNPEMEDLLDVNFPNDFFLNFFSGLLSTPGTVRESENRSADFLNNYALFYQTTLDYYDTLHESREFDFAVLPLPLKDDTQSSYITPTSDSCVLWGIVSGIDALKTRAAAATIEHMAQFSYENLRSILITRYASSMEDMQMLEIILGNIRYDLSILLGSEINDPVRLCSNAVYQGDSSLTSIKKSLENNLKQVAESLKKAS